MTAAIRTDAWTQRDTLADMQDRRQHCLAMAAAADFNNEPAFAVMWQDEADRAERKIAQHLIGLAHGASDALLEDAERRFAARVPVHVFGEEIPDQREGTGAAAYTFGAILIEAFIFMGIPAVCWLWQTLGRMLA